MFPSTLHPKPTKQGEFYRLSTILKPDTGAFKENDIMLTNKKSLSLLSLSNCGKNVLMQGLTHYNQKLKEINNITRQQKPSMMNKYSMRSGGLEQFYTKSIEYVTHDNLVDSLRVCQVEFDECQKGSKELKREESRLKRQFQILYEEQTQRQKQLYVESMPALKNLFKVVKEFRKGQNQGFVVMRKQLENIEKTKEVMIKGMLKCQKEIMKLERFVGIKTEGIVQQEEGEESAQCDAEKEAPYRNSEGQIQELDSKWADDTLSSLNGDSDHKEGNVDSIQ